MNPKHHPWLLPLFAFGLCLAFAPVPVRADTAQPASQVNLTWEEFKKFLKLDAPEIQLTWDEFKQLMAQTGNEIKVEYNVENGMVVLSRDQFKQLLDRMQRPENAAAKPPQDFVVSKADYSGVMAKDSTTFRARFQIEVADQGRKQYVKIPLLPQSLALQQAAVNGRTAWVMNENGWHVLVLNQPGSYAVDAEFSCESSLDRGAEVLQFGIPQTAITLLRLEVPVRAAKADIPQAKYTAAAPAGDRTVITAVLSPSSQVQVKLHRTLAEVKREGPAKVYAETLNLLSLEDDALRARTRLKLDVLQNTISRVEAEIPTGFSVLVVQDQNGDEIRDWTTRPENGRELLTIPLENSQEGTLWFTIMSEKILAADKPEVSFDGFRIPKAIRETGFVGAEKKSTAEAELTGVKNADRVDIQELPFELISLSAKPLIFGLRYLHPPYQLSLKITKHEELPTINTIIDNASVMSVALSEGKTVTRVIYTMRNTWKQFLQLKLPPDSELWTLNVDGQRELPSKNQDGAFLIPLVRSQMEGEAIRPFNVEILYYTKTKPFSLAAWRRLPFPTADVVISQVLWSCYLPVDYSFLAFGGNLEKEKIASGLRPLLGLNRVFTYSEYDGYNEVLSSMKSGGKASSLRGRRLQQVLKSEFRSQAQNVELALTNQLEQEIGFAENLKTAQNQGALAPGGQGLAMLKIEVPTSGQLYRFAKTLVEGEDLYISYVCVQNWIRIVVILLLLAGIGYGLYRARRSVAAAWTKTAAWLRAHESWWSWALTLAGLRLLLAAGAVVFAFVSTFLLTVFVLLFLIAWLKPHWIFRGAAPAAAGAKKTAASARAGRR